MARYIDADALIKELQRRIEEANEAHMAIVDFDFIALVDDADTADVRENVRGEWIVKNGLEHCSVCGVGNGSAYQNFCPNCGARMNDEI